MREIEITADELERLARAMVDRTFNDPDIFVAMGQPQRVTTPFGEAHLVGPHLRLWETFLPFAEEALASAGKLAGVTFVKIDKPRS